MKQFELLPRYTVQKACNRHVQPQMCHMLVTSPKLNTTRHAERQTDIKTLVGFDANSKLLGKGQSYPYDIDGANKVDSLICSPAW